MRLTIPVDLPDIAGRGASAIDRIGLWWDIIPMILIDTEQALGGADHPAHDASDDATDHGSNRGSRSAGNAVAEGQALLGTAGNSLRLRGQRQQERSGQNSDGQIHLFHEYVPGLH
jgi:hypothetical protein